MSEIKRLVNGAAADLTTGIAEISVGSDRLMVRTSTGTNSAVSVRDGKRVLVSYRGLQYVVEPIPVGGTANTGEVGSGELRAPMPGVIADVRVEEGAKVSKGQVIVVLEAMKTQQPLVAPFDGVVTSLNVAVREQVNEGVILAVVEPIMEA